MSQDERFMRRALDLAREARAAAEIPVGAVVVIDDREAGRGRNATISSTDPTAHAEIVALRDAAARIGNHRLIEATLYCTVEPCLMCLGAMLQARIRRLVYGATDPKVGAVARLAELREAGARFNHRFEIVGDVLAEESSELLLEFFRERRTGVVADN
jgi:tRNA(adenine34) deaminase